MITFKPKFEKEGSVYILMTIVRKKLSASIKKSNELVYREIARDMEDYERKKDKLLSLIHSHYKYPPDFWYFYVTYNPRNSLKAYRCLKDKMTGWEIEQIRSPRITEPVHNFHRHIKKIDKEWVSCLQRPENFARTHYFRLDVDKLENMSKVMEQIDRISKSEYPLEPMEFKTPNGCHILLKPFNRGLWEPVDGVELEKDGLLNLYEEKIRWGKEHGWVKRNGVITSSEPVKMKEDAKDMGEFNVY